jgi:hypothetical protein
VSGYTDDIKQDVVDICQNYGFIGDTVSTVIEGIYCSGFPRAEKPLN